MADYYAILHVLPSADADVIKAAFRALARRHHPDSCTDRQEDAHRRMQEINEAYEVLGDEKRRAAYDQEREKAGTEPKFDSKGDNTDAAFEREWSIACRFCPDAKICFDYLANFSGDLAFSFASYLMDTKKFRDCRNVAQNFHKSFLSDYFGKDISIQQFASQLLLCGEKEAAKAVNQAVKILGDSLSEDRLRHLIYSEFSMSKLRISFLGAIYSYADLDATVRFLDEVGIAYSKSFWGGYLKVAHKGEENKISSEECASWVKTKFGSENDFRCVWQGPELWNRACY